MSEPEELPALRRDPPAAPGDPPAASPARGAGPAAPADPGASPADPAVSTALSYRAPRWVGMAGVGLAWRGALAALASLGGGTPLLVVPWLLVLAASAYWQVLSVAYRVDVAAGTVTCRSMVRTWTFLLDDVTAVVPGWRQPWWRGTGACYLVERRSGPPVRVRSGKGAFTLWRSMADQTPAVAVTDADRDERAEASAVRSGFRATPPAG